jgi:hypothetical protein
MADLAGAPLDDDDRAVLDRLAAIDDLLDPPPADLDERVRFVLALGDIESELARLSQEQLVGSGARASERTRTVTFDAHSRTIMITIVEHPDGWVRLDGWLAPAAMLRVELRFPEPTPSRFVTADEAGRFVFDGVPHGLVQLLVHPPDGGPDPGQPRVVTPSLAL